MTKVLYVLEQLTLWATAILKQSEQRTNTNHERTRALKPRTCQDNGDSVTGVCVQAHPGLGWCLCLRHSEQQDRLAGALVLPKMSTGSAHSFNNPG